VQAARRQLFKGIRSMRNPRICGIPESAQPAKNHISGCENHKRIGVEQGFEEEEDALVQGPK
jgi:hypothetical protein